MNSCLYLESPGLRAGRAHDELGVVHFGLAVDRRAEGRWRPPQRVMVSNVCGGCPSRYSTIYTMFPVFSLVLDKDVKSEVAMLYPELYKDLLKVPQASPISTPPSLISSLCLPCLFLHDCSSCLMEQRHGGLLSLEWKV